MTTYYIKSDNVYTATRALNKADAIETAKMFGSYAKIVTRLPANAMVA